MAIVPSGRLLVAGFTDGTLRLFDLTGNVRNKDSEFNQTMTDDDNLFDSDSSEDEFDDDDYTLKSTAGLGSSSSTCSNPASVLVCSKSNQRYGAVACQIHAKGVHTSLQMTVGVSPDGLYAFGGVARGSMELVAVDLSHIERHMDSYGSSDPGNDQARLDLLDLAHVHRYADAKLRGFGACTRLQRHDSSLAGEPTYILLTGKGIKNIHIWSFQPLRDKWQCLYDTQSNGNSISMLHLRYSPTGSLQAISKCDSQKLRVWDLSNEQSENGEKRPKRPPYQDLSGTETTLGIGGDFGFGGCLYEQISLVNLNAEPPYNVSELELPHRGRIGARQQRGELQALQQVVGMAMDSSHVLLEMSDSSVVHFHFEGSVPKLETLLGGGDSRTLCVARIGSSGITVAAMACGGRILLKQIGDESSEGYWGFHGIKPSNDDVASPCADSEAIAQAAGSSVNLFARSNRCSYTFQTSEEESVASGSTPISITSIAAVDVSAKTPANAGTTTNVVPPSGSTTVPESAIKALNSCVLKHAVGPGTSMLGGVAVSPESAYEEAILQRKTKKNKATISTKGTNKDKPERKKLVLHLRVAKDSVLASGNNDENVGSGTRGRYSDANSGKHVENIVRSIPTKSKWTMLDPQQPEVSRKSEHAIISLDHPRLGQSVQAIVEAIPKKKKKRYPAEPVQLSKRSEVANPTDDPARVIESRPKSHLQIELNNSSARSLTNSKTGTGVHASIQTNKSVEFFKRLEATEAHPSTQSHKCVESLKNLTIAKPNGPIEAHPSIPAKTFSESLKTLKVAKAEGTVEAHPSIQVNKSVESVKIMKVTKAEGPMEAQVHNAIESLVRLKAGTTKELPIHLTGTKSESRVENSESRSDVASIQCHSNISFDSIVLAPNLKENLAKPNFKDVSQSDASGGVNNDKQTSNFVLEDLRPASSTARSIKSPRTIAPRKRKALSPRPQPTPPSFPTSIKKSRVAIDTNLGNLDSVNVVPTNGWLLPSKCISQRFGSIQGSDNEIRRIKLALEHRASHETLRKQVLESVSQLIRSVNHAESFAVDEVRNSLEDIIAHYTEILVSVISIPVLGFLLHVAKDQINILFAKDDLLFRQDLEASTLAATSFLPFKIVVSFPFPEVFDQARKAISLFLDNQKKDNQQISS